jgi:hypothetical protein
MPVGGPSFFDFFGTTIMLRSFFSIGIMACAYNLLWVVTRVLVHADSRAEIVRQEFSFALRTPPTVQTAARVLNLRRAVCSAYVQADTMALTVKLLEM